MLTYHQVMTTDLALLTTAAAQWDAAAKDFESVQKTYDSQVRNVTVDGQWAGVASTFARRANTLTYEQYSAAAKEARAIASLLRDAHEQFVELRGKVKSAVADAEKAGMKVGAEGTATFNYDKADKALADAARHDPDLHRTESNWTGRIADAVRAVDDADHGVKLALKAATEDSDPNDQIWNGFNAKAEGDIEVVEGRRSTELATKLNSTGRLDAEELAEMQSLLRDNSHSKEFSRTFLAGLSPDKTIGYADKLRGLADGDSKKDYAPLRDGLAATLATATQDTKAPFYDTWRKGLREAGAKNYGSNTSPVYGYQSFVEMMKHGKGYGKQFLSDIGDDIISTEKKRPGIWNKISGHKDVPHDPLDGLLGIMGKQPDAATSFLDPGADGKNGRLTYLLKDRDWPGLTVIGPAGVKNFDDPASRLGLGAALEAAATGDVPGTKHVLGGHTEAEARVMQHTVQVFNEGKKIGDVHANLRPSLGHMLTDYTSDTHEILSLTRRAYTDGAPSEGIGKVWTADGTTRMAVHPADLARLMREVAEDPAAFAGMYNAERQYTADTLTRTPFDEEEPRKLAIRNASSAFGFYDGVSADVVYDKRDKAIQWARDVSHAVTATSGAALNFIPSEVGGVEVPKGVKIGADGINRIVDFAMYDWTKEQIAHANEAAGQDNRRDYYAYQLQVDHLVTEWAKRNGHADPDDPFVRNLVGGAKDKHFLAREQGLNALDRNH
ncbi:DUF6571 family protein [Streptomyces stramineus]